MIGETYNYLFVSDLHIASGFDPDKKAFHPREDFFYDHEFFRFLIWADKQGGKKKWELVFNGDCFDFLPIETTLHDYHQFMEYFKPGKKIKEENDWRYPIFKEQMEGVSTGGGGEFIQHDDPIDTWQKRHGFLPTEGVSLSRFRLILRGHPVFFDALAWWVGRGHRLVMIPGNHDQELAWDQVQEEFCSALYYSYQFPGEKDPFRELLHAFQEKLPPVRRMTEAAFRRNIDFSHKWFYYKPGLFYAEHGHQYEFGNSINNLLTPWVKTKYEKGGKGPRIKVLNYPIGSLIVEALVGPLEDAYPEWENASSLGSYVGNLFVKKPLFMLRFLWRQGGEFWRMLKGIEAMRDENEQKGPFPPDVDVESEAGREGLPKSLGPRLYDNWARPLLSYPKFSAAVLGPWRYFWIPAIVLASIILVILGVGGVVLLSSWVNEHITLKIANFIFPKTLELSQDPENWSLPDQARWWGANALTYTVGFLGVYYTVKTVLSFVTKPLASLIMDLFSDQTKKLVERYIMPTEYIKNACQRAHALLRSTLTPRDTPYYYIMGHDHLPNFHMIEGQSPDRERQTFYVNTGSWLPAFNKENVRRMRTGGSDSEFTFFMVSEKTNWEGEAVYFGELMRWNDNARCAQPQITPPFEIDYREKREIDKKIRKRAAYPQKLNVDEILALHKMGNVAKRQFQLLEEKIKKNWGLSKKDNESLDVAIEGGIESAFAGKLKQDTHFVPGINQWVIAYWTIGTFRKFCEIQVKPAGKTADNTARFPEKQPRQNPNAFFVIVPISDGIGEAICKQDGVLDAMKDIVRLAMKESERRGFVTLAVENSQDCDSVFEALRAVKRWDEGTFEKAIKRGMQESEQFGRVIKHKRVKPGGRKTQNRK